MPCLLLGCVFGSSNGVLSSSWPWSTTTHHKVILLAPVCSLCAEPRCACRCPAPLLLWFLPVALLRPRLQVPLMCGNSCSACVTIKPTMAAAPGASSVQQDVVAQLAAGKGQNERGRKHHVLRSARAVVLVICSVCLLPFGGEAAATADTHGCRAPGR
jgi:hypothetical protein